MSVSVAGSIFKWVCAKWIAQIFPQPRKKRTHNQEGRQSDVDWCLSVPSLWLAWLLRHTHTHYRVRPAYFMCVVRPLHFATRINAHHHFFFFFSNSWLCQVLLFVNKKKEKFVFFFNQRKYEMHMTPHDQVAVCEGNKTVLTFSKSHLSS